jgi:hypothetical protein
MRKKNIKGAAMGMFHKLKVGDMTINSIDWEMTPDLTFGTFESWGGRERVRNNNELIYYFFVDNWGDEPKLCLMERGVKHAKVIAEIKAPVKMVSDCVESQGRVSFFERSFAINDDIQEWLINNVLDDGDTSLVHPVMEKRRVEDMGRRLPLWDGESIAGERVLLPAEQVVLSDEQVEEIIKRWNFYDSKINPAGSFGKHLCDGGPHTVIDQRTGLMWQRGGLDIASLRTMNKMIEKLNEEGFADHHDWRLPTLEEAMSLLEPERNDKGIYLNSNFSREQPFIFVAAQRTPGGYWFVDYKQGSAFWSSGTIPGGFGRLCRAMAV